MGSFVQAEPNGSIKNTLVFVGDELIEVTPVNEYLVQSSYDLAVGMQARFFFRRVTTPAGIMLDGYDVEASLRGPTAAGHMKVGAIKPQRRFPNKDAAVMWAIHRGAR